jgi:DNA polymerase V
MIEAVRTFVASGGPNGEASERGIPLFGTAVRAGLPTFADDHVEARLDLHTHLVPHPQTTFFVRVQGDSMENAGIQEGDLLVVDRSIPAKEGAIIIAALDGELTVKRLRYQLGQPQLVPENDKYRVITIEPDNEFHIWGVVTSVIHKV